MNVSKLKIAELKKELKDRGLPTSGNKSELAARLKDALAADGADSAAHEDDLDAKESELLGEEEEEDEDEAASGEELDTKLLDTSTAAPPAAAAPASKPKKIVINREAAESAQQAAATAIAEAAKVAPPEPAAPAPASDVTEAGDAPPASKKIKLTTGLSETERLAKRAQKLGAPIEAGKLSSLKILTAEERKAARLAKFGAAAAAADAAAAATPAAAATAAPAEASGKITAPQKNGTEDLEKLKKRADRFGEAVSAKVLTLEESERLKKRKERFGIVTPEDTKAKRAARFSSSAPVAPDPATDDKKKQRAARFGMA